MFTVWHDPATVMPPVGLLVFCKMRHDFIAKYTTVAYLKHVDEDDCSWRLDDDSELSYNWTVLSWRLTEPWVFQFVKWLFLLIVRSPMKQAATKRDKSSVKPRLRLEQRNREKWRRFHQRVRRQKSIFRIRVRDEESAD